jgi:hypothetical protein
VSIVDLLAIFPFFLSLLLSTYLPSSSLSHYLDSHQWDNHLRLIRVLRVLKMDQYIPSVTLIDDVFRIKRYCRVM